MSFLLELKPVYYEDPPGCDKCGSDAKVRYVKQRKFLCLKHYRADKNAPHHSDVRRVERI